jgi:GR25 family glycosyltransferase involved in LPS biosynthesis
VTTLEKYFGKIFVINLKRRPDRLRHFYRQMLLGGVDFTRIERFDAFDRPNNGMVGATKSHREVIRQIANGPWSRALIFEDDAEPITVNKLKDGGFKPEQDVWKTHCSVLNGGGNFQQRFGALAQHVPDKWDMLWLGGGYGSPPISRINRHVIRFRSMKCCAAYALTREFAKEWTKRTDATQGPETGGQVDEMFHPYADEFAYYVFQPRLIFTGKNMSDVSGQENSYLFSMTDPVAENMV